MKKVLITGGTRGIGRACAELFKNSGYDVFVTYLRSTEYADELRKIGIGAEVCDVSDSLAVKTLHQRIGDIDILVNNAGIAWYGLLSDMKEEEWDRIFDINVKGMFNCIKEFSPFMIREKEGSVVNISSMWGITGGSCEVAYSASKAAVIGLTKALAKELGPSGVRVNCVAPGVIKTDMISSLSEEDLNALAEDTPLCRLGMPEDVAKAVMYLSESDFITGEVLNINGGMVI